MSIRVLIVDDSATVRQTLERELGKAPDLEVIGTAPDPYVARDKIVTLKPDVVLLDVEMPRMDGITFLRKLMQHYPIPVIIVSSLAQGGSRVAVEAMSAGAIDIVAKPGAAYSVGDMAIELCEKIRAAARSDMKNIVQRMDHTPLPALQSRALAQSTNRVVVIGASTGGTQALECVIRQYPRNAPATVVVQHMPAGFTRSFADRLNEIAQVEVKEAENGDALTPGRVLIAPGNKHTMVRRSGAQYFVEVKDGPLVERHRPSVEVLFQSAVQYLAANAVAVMLTGMGGDGSKAMKLLRDTGARTIAQDEATCVVFGMPKVAIELGAVETVLPIEKITAQILRYAGA